MPPRLVGFVRTSAAQAPGPAPPISRSDSPVPQESNADAEPLLQIALKPFGKWGVRLGWKLDPEILAAGGEVFIELHRADEWHNYSELQHCGNANGVTTIKTVYGSNPSQCAAREIEPAAELRCPPPSCAAH